MSKLSIHYDALHEFKTQARVFDIKSVPFGFDSLDCKGFKKLIDIEGCLISYFEFDTALMLINATKLQVAQMVADKDIYCFNVNYKDKNDITALDFAFYSWKYNK